MYLSHNVNEDHKRHGLHQGGHELDEPPDDAGEHHPAAAAGAGHCCPLLGVLMSWPPDSCLLPGHVEPWPSLPRHRHHRTSHAAGFSRQLRSPNCSPVRRRWPGPGSAPVYTTSCHTPYTQLARGGQPAGYMLGSISGGPRREA